MSALETDGTPWPILNFQTLESLQDIEGVSFFLKIQIITTKDDRSTAKSQSQLLFSTTDLHHFHHLYPFLPILQMVRNIDHLTTLQTPIMLNKVILCFSSNQTQLNSFISLGTVHNQNCGYQMIPYYDYNCLKWVWEPSKPSKVFLKYFLFVSKVFVFVWKV